MSSLIFAQAKAIRNRAKKHATAMAMNAEMLDQDHKQAYQDGYNQIIRNEINEFKAILEIATELHTVYTEMVGKTTTNHYFITIRPDESKTNLIDFIIKVEKFVKRKCFLDYTLSFEQKGTSIDTLGQGFHAHIVAECSWRSKGEALRDTQSSFQKCTAPNCIEVKTTRNPQDIVNNYMIEYKSDDGHKESTKQWDHIWRTTNNIKSIYKPGDTLLSSSPVTEANSV